MVLIDRETTGLLTTGHVTTGLLDKWSFGQLVLSPSAVKISSAQRIFLVFFWDNSPLFPFEKKKITYVNARDSWGQFFCVRKTLLFMMSNLWNSIRSFAFSFFEFSRQKERIIVSAWHLAIWKLLMISIFKRKLKNLTSLFKRRRLLWCVFSLILIILSSAQSSFYTATPLH